MKVIILGQNGMLAHIAKQIIPHDLIIGSNCYDLSRYEEIEWMVADNIRDDDIVINCVGYLRQNISSNPTLREKHNAFVLNSYLPSYLADKCKLITVSTNCVFDPNQTQTGYRTENELPDGKDLYAHTKIWGEPSHEAMVLRTSIIGLECKNHKGLIGWFLQQKEATGFVNHLWNGMTTITLSNCIKSIIDNNLYKPGIFHLLSTTISKYDILNEVNKYRKEPAILHKKNGPPVHHTLGTNNLDFLNKMPIPHLFDQIAEMMTGKIK